MANKAITPTTPVLATSTVGGRIALVWPGFGPYLVPYKAPTAPATPALPSTDDFAHAVYNQLNLDNLVGTDDWINLLTDPLFLNGVDGWTCDANYTLAQSTEQNLFGQYSLKSLKASAGATNGNVYCPVQVLQPGTVYTASVYVYIPSAFPGSFVSVGADTTFTGAVIDSTNANANMATRNKWQRIWITIQAAVGDVSGQPIIVRSDNSIISGASSAIYIASPQLEIAPTPSAFTDNVLFAPAKVITQSFIGSIGAAFEQMDDLAHANPQWSSLLDVNRIPDEGLPWFGQFTGTIVDPNLGFNDQRQQIRANPGWHRGTKDAIALAVRPLLTGTQAVQIVERDTTPYHFNIATYGAETPDPNLVTVAVNRVKPAGLQFSYTVIPGSPGTATTYANLYFDFLSYQVIMDEKTTYQDVYLHP